MRLIFILASSAVLASSTALAAPKDPKKDDSQKLVCKADEFVGSRISRRICKTRAEWEEGAIDARRALDDRGRGGDYRQPTGPK